MKLYFLRHGLAEERDEWQGNDSDRPLTEGGKDQMAQEASFLAELGLKIDAILTSPLARARQTADIVAQGLQMTDRLFEDKLLEPGFNRDKLEKVVRSYPDSGALMLVGHEPDFSVMIGEITGGSRVAVKKGGLACINLPDPTRLKGELIWLIPPKVLAQPRVHPAAAV